MMGISISKLSGLITGILVAIFLFQPVLAQDTAVTIYCDDNYPPYSFKENGKAAGIYTDIFEKAFSRMKGFKITIKPIPWKRGINLVKEGKGFALYPPYYRPRVRPFMDYPVPILDEEYAMLTSQELATGTSKKWPEDYNGMRIGINAGFSVPDMDKAKALGIKIEEAVSNRSNLLKLATGRLDGYINDKNAMLWELKQLKQKGEYDENKDQKLAVATLISKEQGYMGFTNQDKGKFKFKQAFIQQFVTIINQMKNSDEIQVILDSYIK